MLVANNKVHFQKAKGRIIFVCNDGDLIDNAIQKAISTGRGQTCWMKSEGKDSAGELVSVFEFEWTVKIKK